MHTHENDEIGSFVERHETDRIFKQITIYILLQMSHISTLLLIRIDYKFVGYRHWNAS